MKALLTQYSVVDIVSQFGDTINADNGTFDVVDKKNKLIDISGYDKAKLIITDEDGDEKLTFDKADSEILLFSGYFVLIKAAADMQDLPAGRYIYKCVIELGEDVITIMKGKWVVQR